MRIMSRLIVLAGLAAVVLTGCSKVTVVSQTTEPVLIIVGHPPALPDVPEPPPPPPPPPPPKVALTEDAIRIDEPITFVGKSADLEPDAYAVLDEVVAVLADNPGIKKISIEAHTDGEGSGARNKKLSVQQAEAVREYLVERGIDAARMKTKGLGESQPRVEIRILVRDPAREDAP